MFLIGTENFFGITVRISITVRENYAAILQGRL
jgi:hypothetical protein